ncbi:MAG: ABC transporter permease [Bacillati bacterium ANGP1]|uniref:ABC transporter permease n=1 Tax=Candidatus Segetimicrobium genomatis TaxID=2569760 RepID=A0A537LCB6_9BACT|nr:MAG: ABC transporter permease [Terrabacteria group bacterium ANGP1]
MRYSTFLIQRVLLSVLVLLGLSILIFMIARVIPGDPARIALGPLASRSQIEALRAQMHLDEPLYVQYAYYLAGLLRGDFGESLYTHRAVAIDLRDLFPATLELVFYSGLLMVVIGVPLGIVAAVWRDRWVDHTVRLVSLAGVVTPAFVWAIVLMLVFAYALGVLPVAGRLSPGLVPPSAATGTVTLDALLAGNLRAYLDFLRHLILPSVSLSLAGVAQAARLTRASMVDVAGRPYIEAARAFGISESRIALKYMLKPSMIPTVTILGLDFAALLGNAFLVESVFAWPGIARYGVEVILRKDLNAIVAVVMIMGLFFVVINFCIDMLVGYLDPRIRLRQMEDAA